jgi:hypothetical protein
MPSAGRQSAAFLRFEEGHLPTLLVFTTARRAERSFVQPSPFSAKCTIVHKRKIPAGANDSHNNNKSLPLRRSWLRFAKSRRATPTGEHPRRLEAGNQTAPLETGILSPNRQFIFRRTQDPRKARSSGTLHPIYMCTKMHKPQNRCHLPLPG